MTYCQYSPRLHPSAAHPIRFTITERAADIHGTGSQSVSRHDLNKTQTQPRCSTTDLQMLRQTPASAFSESHVRFRPVQIESAGSDNASIDLRINSKSDHEINSSQLLGRSLSITQG